MDDEVMVFITYPASTRGYKYSRAEWEAARDAGELDALLDHDLSDFDHGTPTVSEVVKTESGWTTVEHKL